MVIWLNPLRPNDQCSRCGQAVAVVKRDECPHINIADTVAIGEAKGLFILKITSYAFEATTCQGFITGVHQGYSPRLCLFVVNFHLIAGHIKSHV